MKNKPDKQLMLYISSTCSYCQKVISFPTCNNIDIPIVDVDNDKNSFEEMRQFSGGTQVPCLRIGDTFMLESDDIIEQFRKWATE